MIGNILDKTTELYMIKYTFGEIFSSGGSTLCKNPSDQTVLPALGFSAKTIIFIALTYELKILGHICRVKKMLYVEK